MRGMSSQQMTLATTTTTDTEPTKKIARQGDVRVRLATNSEGTRILELLTHAGFKVDGLDWSKIAPFWLVAEMNGQVLGCIQVCLGLPIGRAELLAVDPNVTHVLRALLVKRLIYGALSTIKASGAQAATSLVPFEMKSYKKILKKMGCVSMGAGNEMAKLLI